MSLNHEQQEAVSALERHVQDNVRLVLQLKSGTKPEASKLSEFIDQSGSVLSACDTLGVPGATGFEVTEYEDYTTLKFSVDDFKALIGKAGGAPASKANGKAKKEKLTADQEDALRTLTNYLEGSLQAILDLRNSKKPGESQLSLLVEQAMQGMEACENAGVPDSAAIELTNWSDSDKSKIKFTIKEIRSEIPKWQKSLKALVKDQGDREAAYQKEKASQKKKEEEFDSMSDDQREVIQTLNNNWDQIKERMQNMMSGADYHALLNGPSEAQYLQQLLSGLKKSKLADSYLLEDANVTAGEIKKSLPGWIKFAEQGADIAELMNQYSMMRKRYDDALNGDVIAREYSLEAIKNLEGAIKNADKNLSPDTVIKGNPGDNIDDMTFGDLKKQFPKWKKVFEQGEQEREARQKRAMEKYTKVLSGDKLKIFKSELANSMVVDVSEKVSWRSPGYYDVNMEFISKPEDFAKAKIWATYSHFYEEKDMLKARPNWRLYAYHFDGMKLVNETKNGGVGSESPPASEFKFKAKK